jgi:hypothetical protein
MKALKAIYLSILFYLAKGWFTIRRAIVGALVRLKVKLQRQSLREAIHGADQDKAQTGRKNMVVYNTASGQYEPWQKQLLKAAARSGKNKSNKALTEGRKRELAKQRRKKRRILDTEKVHRIEKRSLYVTD